MQVVWGSSYPSLAAFRAAQPTQEVHGLEADPLLTAPAVIAQRPAAAPFNVAINVGDYHLVRRLAGDRQRELECPERAVARHRRQSPDSMTRRPSTRAPALGRTTTVAHTSSTARQPRPGLRRRAVTVAEDGSSMSRPPAATPTATPYLRDHRPAGPRHASVVAGRCVHSGRRTGTAPTPSPSGPATASRPVATVTITVTPVNDAPVSSVQGVTTAEDAPWRSL